MTESVGLTPMCAVGQYLAPGHPAGHPEEERGKVLAVPDPTEQRQAPDPVPARQARPGQETLPEPINGNIARPPII